MTLTLEVNRIAGGPPPQPLSANFDQTGGSIGRREDNDWVLPDPERFISGRHALISFSDGRFYITDVSANGVFLNQSESALGNEAPAPLQQGDTLTIGEYDIVVSLHETALQAADAGSFDALDDPFARLLADNAGIQLESGFAALDPARDEASGEPLFTLDEVTSGDLQTDAPPDLQPMTAAPSEPDRVSDLNAYYSQPGHIPEDWQVEETRAEGGPSPIPFPVSAPLSSPGPEAPPQRGPEALASSRDDAACVDPSALRGALTRGLGLSSNLLDEVPLNDLLESLGQVLRCSVTGAMSLLRARTQMKSEFRMSQTMIKPVENNPLKFSVNPEEALRHIIDPRPNSGYLSPLAAFREAHEDTEAHMLAVMVGMQSALKAVLLRFKPENLEKRLQQTVLLEKVPLYRRAKSWELFTELYGEIANEAEDDFQQLFGRAFSQAYEAQIRRLATLKHTHGDTTNQDRN